MCLTLLLVKCCKGTKERHQRRKITLAEFLYQRLHRLGIKKNRRRQHQIPFGKTKTPDKIDYLLHNRNSDPNLVVLQNYFRKIKSQPETSEPEETAAKDSTKKFAFAGFGPIVRTANNNKKKSVKSSNKKKRPGRKIFMTVDEAFSESDFGHFGREMREREDNYFIYVPVPRQIPEHNIPTPQQVGCVCVKVINKRSKYSICQYLQENFFDQVDFPSHNGYSPSWNISPPEAGRVVTDENRRMDPDTEEGLDDMFTNVYADVPVSIEVSLESGYHAGEVHLQEEDVNSVERSYQTNFVSDSDIVNVTGSEGYLTNFENHIESMDSELYRTSFESDYVYDYREIERSDDSSDENYYYDSLDADYFEEMKTMENLIEQNSDLYMTNFHHVETVSPGYTEFTLDVNSSNVLQTELKNSQTKTLSDIEGSLTTEMTFFEDQTTDGFRVNNSFGLEKGERVSTYAIPAATSGELNLAEFDGINSTFASDGAKMDIEMSQRKSSSSKSEMTFLIPQNNPIVPAKSQVNLSVTTAPIVTATAMSTTTKTVTLSETSTTTTSTTTTTTTTTMSTRTTTTTTKTTSTTPSPTTTTSPTTSTTTSTSTSTYFKTFTVTTTTRSSATTITSLTTISTQSLSIVPSLETHGYTDIMPRKMPLVDSKTSDESDPDADTDDNSVLIPVGHGLYTKFVLNKDTKLDFNFLDFI